MDEPAEPQHWLLSEAARAVLINAPLVSMLVSAEYSTHLFQDRPHQPDPNSGFVQMMDHKGIKVFATPNEAWLSQSLANLSWVILAICVAAFLLRLRLKPGAPVLRLPEEGVYFPAEFIATLVVMATIAFGIVMHRY